MAIEEAVIGRDYSIDEARQLPTSCGIYAIVNICNNGYRYVGQALNIRQRVLTHVRDLTAGRERTNKDGLLQNAWNEFERGCFVVRILEFITDNRRLTAYHIRPDNINLAEHYYINLDDSSRYNRDKRIVASKFHALVAGAAWRTEIDAATLALIAAAKPRPYLVARRKDWAHAVVVLGPSSEDAKRIATLLDSGIESLGRNLSTKRLSPDDVFRELAKGAKDLRHVQVREREALASRSDASLPADLGPEPFNVGKPRPPID